MNKLELHKLIHWLEDDQEPEPITHLTATILDNDQFAQMLANYATGWRDMQTRRYKYPYGHIAAGCEYTVCHAWKAGEPDAKWDERREFTRDEALDIIEMFWAVNLRELDYAI